MTTNSTAAPRGAPARDEGASIERHPGSIAFLMAQAGRHRGGFAFSTVLATLGVACGLAPYFVAAAVFVALMGGEQDPSTYLLLCGIAALGYFGKVVLGNVATVVAHRAAFGTMENIRTALISKLSRMPLGDVLATPSGRMANVIVDKVEGFESTLAHLIPEMTANVIVPVALVVYMFVLDWRMALVALAVIALGMPFMGAMAKGASLQEGAARTRGRMSGIIVEYVNGIKVIKTFCQGTSSYRTYHDAVVDNASYHYEWMRASELGMAGYLVIWPSTLLTVLPVGCLFFAGGSLDSAVFVTIMIVSLATMQPLMSITTFASSVVSLGSSVKAVREVLEAPELVRPAPSGGDSDEAACAAGECNVRFEDVHFSYRGGDEVLRGVSLDIPQGTTCALVGASGSGKSTVAKLLAGLWDPDSGTVSVGGVSVQELSQARLSNLVSYVSQDNYLFDDTVRNNIRIGRESATDEEVERAVRELGCESFILGLVDGYDTVTGNAGGHLSGGERQRVTIARAMLRHAPIVVMDESTAYMDPENEAVVQAAVSRLVKGRTLVVIAHRLSTVKGSDQIAVIDEGRVAAVGTHDELLQESDLYRAMWRAHVEAKDGDIA